jgi:flagellar L-ring protein precursor FlgH
MKITNRARIALLFAAVCASACTSLSSRQAARAPTPEQLAVASPPRSAGAIYQAGRDIAFFEDTKAHRAGDLITIRLQETTSASKSSTTSTKKDTSLTNAGPTILGRPVTVNGTPILQNSLSGASAFDGQGKSSQSNQLQGSITVTVVQALPNGNLRVQGEKWLNLNQGDEFVRISGIVRALDVAADNSVTSDKVADAKISYSGKGFVQNSNRMGWLARFFNAPLSPF